MPFVTGTYNDSGPILEVFIGVSEPRRRMMIARGQEVAKPIRLNLIIDTGATTTMINDQFMRTLCIPARGTRSILTATNDEKPTECSTYDVEFAVHTIGDPAFRMSAIEVLGKPLFNHSIDGMIGKDVLSKLVLIIEGPARRFRIQY